MLTGQSRRETLDKALKDHNHNKLVRGIDEVIQAAPGFKATPPPSPFDNLKPNVNLPIHKPFYQLSEDQFTKMVAGANENLAWVAPYPMASDDAEKRAALLTICQEMVDLEALGLLVDCTKTKYKNNADYALATYGRHSRFYDLTSEALLMFRGTEERKAN